MVGREEELAELRGRLETVPHDRGQLILIEGEAGVGKTRLIDEILTFAHKRGFAVRRAGCEEIERTLPFRVITRALRGAHDSTDAGFTVIDDLLTGRYAEETTPLLPGQNELRYRLLEEVISLVENEASLKPLVIVLEDLQWADPSSLLAVRTLARRITPLRVALLCTLRPTPRSPELMSVIEGLASEGAVFLGLQPLTDENAFELMETIVGARPEKRLREVAAGAAGNPLFLVELARSLLQSDAVEFVDGRAELKDVRLPQSLRETILRRVNFLSRETMRLLQVASVLGSSFKVNDLCAIVGRSIVELLPALEEATNSGLIVADEERIRFRHDLLQAVLYEELGSAIRSELHREAARVLAAAGRPPGEVAMHIAVGASVGDLEAIDWLRRAARSAAPRAPTLATELLRHALDLVDPSDVLREELITELVASLVWSGEPAQAEKLAIEALSRVDDSETVGTLRWALASASAIQGRLNDALQHTEAAASETGLPAWRRARLLADASQWRFYTGDVDGARDVAAMAVEEGTASEDVVATGLGLSALSRVAMERADFPTAISFARKALQTISGTPSEKTETDWIHPSFDLAGALVVADRLSEAEDVLREGRRLREQIGSTWDLPLFTNTLAYTHLYRGDWDDAVAEAQTVLSLMDEGGAKGSALWAVSLLAYVAMHREGVEAAREILEQAQQVINLTGPLMGSDQVLWCEALVQETLGDEMGAWALIQEAWHLNLPFKVVTRSRMGPDAVRLAEASGHAAEARSFVDDLERLAEKADVPLYKGVALRCRGLIDKDVDALLRSVAALRNSSRPIELAFACEDAGVALAALGRVAEAGTLLREAIDSYEEVGAARDVSRSEAALRAAGLRSGRRGKRSRETEGWSSLTRSERDVVDLVARGLTNREVGARLFISRRTVETHLSHIFRKLRVSSRVELAANAALRSPHLLEGEPNTPAGGHAEGEAFEPSPRKSTP